MFHMQFIQRIQYVTISKTRLKQNNNVTLFLLVKKNVINLCSFVTVK